jgi:transposase
VLDRFHIAKKLGEAVDEVRRAETKELKQGGYDPVLSKSRSCLLKRPANLTANQETKLKELLRYDLKSVRAYLLKESFDARCRPHPDESHPPHSQARIEASHAPGASGIPQRHEHPVHEDDLQKPRC